MTVEELDAIKACSEKADKHSSLKYVWESWHDNAALIAEVERLTLERAAAVADLQKAITTTCDDMCFYCKNLDTEECTQCDVDEHESKWEWRGAREAANG